MIDSFFNILYPCFNIYYIKCIVFYNIFIIATIYHEWQAMLFGQLTLLYSTYFLNHKPLNIRARLSLLHKKRAKAFNELLLTRFLVF